MKQLALILCAVALAASIATAAQPVCELRGKEEQRESSDTSARGGLVAVGLCAIKDGIQAVKWARETADQGYMTAQTILDSLHSAGTAVATDALKTVKWIRETAGRGYARVRLHLGSRCARETSVARDEIEAAKAWREAAEQGDACAQFNLGVALRDGTGVAKDEVEAYALFNLAAVTEEDAREAREAMERTLSRDEISAGQRRSRQLTEEIAARFRDHR